MNHERYRQAIQELADGTLGPIRRAELEMHLDDCESCQRLADDLLRIRDLAASLETLAPPDRIWPQIAGRLRQEGRIVSTPVAVASRRLAPLALAASLLLIVGASLYLLYPRNAAPAGPAAGNAAGVDAVQGVETELRLAEQHFENAITKLQEIAKSDDDSLEPLAKAILEKNVAVIDQAIAESRAALKAEPQSAPARNSLFGALKAKVTLLQDTITLMNQMRKGDAAGAAQVVDSVNKS